MITKSAWGSPPKRIYQFISMVEKNIGLQATVCVVGCSDGKFVMPFLRKGHLVTGIDFDKVALYGGNKIVPIKRNHVNVAKYIPSNKKNKYESLPVLNIKIDGLLTRAQKEGIADNLGIIETDFYRNNIKGTFDVVFTSCSIQYKSNRDIPINEMMNQLKGHVSKGGYLYMDYMMPLEDKHDWKSQHFFRTGQIIKYFDKCWRIIYKREMGQPIFEVAHIDRPEDHFHRFGYILAQRMI